MTPKSVYPLSFIFLSKLGLYLGIRCTSPTFSVPPLPGSYIRYSSHYSQITPAILHVITIEMSTNTQNSSAPTVPRPRFLLICIVNSSSNAIIMPRRHRSRSPIPNLTDFNTLPADFFNRRCVIWTKNHGSFHSLSLNIIREVCSYMHYLPTFISVSRTTVTIFDTSNLSWKSIQRFAATRVYVDICSGDACACV